MGGGPSPGINAVIAAATIEGRNHGLRVLGIRDGFKPLVQGEVESTRIDIAARVSGRLVKVPVSRGQDVAAGTTLLVIDNPELVVQLHEAEAGKLVADAELARINVGTRSEIIAQRKAEIDRAAADLTLAQQTYNRTKQLAAAKFAPQSKLDQDTSFVDLSDSWLGFSLRCDRGAG